MLNTNVNKDRAGFTIVNLLFLIVILVALVFMFLPASSHLSGSKKVRAGMMVNSLKTALESYHSDYGVWPYDHGVKQANTKPSNTSLSIENAYTLLIGDPMHKLDHTSCSNPRGTVYMEFKIIDLDARDYASATMIVDPWFHQDVPWYRNLLGHKTVETTHSYVIYVDANESHNISISTPPFNGNHVNADVAIWSNGDPECEASTITTEQNNCIKSW